MTDTTTGAPETEPFNRPLAEATNDCGRMTPVVAEEWSHFERVIEQLNKRGMTFGKMRKDEYVISLSKILKKGGSREQQLVEKLLMNALIEARSCERFKLLSQNIEDEELQKFYYDKSEEKLK
mgnify:CR=1 FL=1